MTSILLGVGCATENQNNINKTAEKSMQLALQDSDNDGLTDEEELSYYTDPLNPDTDDDGYPDGLEVSEGYDPLEKPQQSAQDTTTNTGNKITISVTPDEYSISAAKQSANVHTKIDNTLTKNIYFEDPVCKEPIKIHELLNGNTWKVRKKTSTCFGLSPGEDTPTVLEPNKNLDIQKTVSREGTYITEFIYYLSEEHYGNRTNPQNIFSNQFTLRETNATTQSIIDACMADDPRENRVVECIYVAAKNAATTDLTLSINLCKEIEKMNSEFDGCYDGVTIMLGKAGLEEEINTVCSNYDNQLRIDQCLNMTR